MIGRLLYRISKNKDGKFFNCNKCIYRLKCITGRFENKMLPEHLKYIGACENFTKFSESLQKKIMYGSSNTNETGSIFYNNNFDFSVFNIKRFYMIDLFKRGVLRGWHGHKYESKYCMCLNGIVKVGMVKIDDFENPSENLVPEWYILKEGDKEILYIPDGYANGLIKMNGNSKDCKILFFSDKIYFDSKDDDYRYDSKMWR